MAPPQWTQDIDNMFTSTWAHRQGPAVVQALLSNPFIHYMKEKGRVQDVRGHRRLEVDVDYGENNTLRWLGKGGTVPMGDDELVTKAYDEWRYVAVSITRYGTEDHKNQGAAAVIPYVAQKLTTAERDIWTELERVVNADGTGSDEPNGLQNLISVTPTTGIVHGLNRATYAWWRNQQKTTSGAFSVYGLSDMRNIYNTCRKYDMVSRKDYIIMTDQDSYEAYDDEVLEQKQIVNKIMGDADFEHNVYKGLPLIWSPSAPANEMRFVNTKYMVLKFDSSYWFDMTEWKAIPDQVNDKVAQIISALNLMTDRPVTHGVLGTTP